LETNLQNLIDKLETIAKEFCDNPIIFEENTFVCRFSYGISKFPENGIDYNDLIRIADRNMYDYKQKLKKSL
jgi:GGDEF domain-containing protein